MNLPVAAHSTHPYLPMSQSWIYHQLVFLKRYRPIVLTKRTENLDYFPLEPIYALYPRPALAVAREKLGRLKSGYFPLYRKALVEQKAVLLHSHGGPFGRADWRLARDLGLPHVVSFYGADIWLDSRVPKLMRIYHELFRASHLFLVEGNAMREKVVSLGCDPAKVRVHHLGINLDKVAFTPRKVGPDGRITFLMAGRAIEKKGHVYGLQAFARLARKHPGLRLLIMTWGTYKDTEQNVGLLRQVIAQEQLGDRAEIMGLRPYHEYLEITKRCHLFLSPSVHASNGDAEGGFPVTITELLASGMPVIGTSHCDIPEIVRDGETGFLAPERDVDALAAKMEEAVLRPEAWRGLAENGRALVEKEYNAHVQAARLEDLYDDLPAANRTS